MRERGDCLEKDYQIVYVWGVYQIGEHFFDRKFPFG